MPEFHYGDHPEAALGIPNIVITARPAFKAKYAKLCDYSGPLTLAEAVAQRRVSYADALALIAAWERETNRSWPEEEMPKMEYAHRA